jgi:tripartite-type tricarboxylate transporter receptor subunit TctC
MHDSTGEAPTTDPARRRVLRPAAALLATLAVGGLGSAPSRARAQGTDRFPERAVKLTVPFVPGGVVDMVARLFAQQLAEPLGQPVVVENKGGGGGTIGADAVAKSAPDGYTLLMATASTHGTSSATSQSLPYDPIRDFAPVTLLATTPYALVAHPAVPASNVAELVAWARAHPGKLNFGSFGPGSSNHLAAELFKALAGVDIVHVPYRGAAPAMTDLIGGQIQIMFDTFPSSIPNIQTNKIKLIGVGGKDRFPLFKDTPTLDESGVRGYAAGTWFGVFAPAGTPQDVIARLQRAFVGVLQQPQVRSRLLTTGLEPVGSSPQELGDLAKREIALWRKLVQERGLKFD